MKEELDVLQQNQNWVLILRTLQYKVLNCKWVYTLKQNDRGKITRHKARLVAIDMRQIDGVDVKETFTPIIKPSTIWLVLSITVSRGWNL